MRLAILGVPERLATTVLSSRDGVTRSRSGAEVAAHRWVRSMIQHAAAVEQIDLFVSSLAQRSESGHARGRIRRTEELPGLVRTGAYDVVHDVRSAIHLDKGVYLARAAGTPMVASAVHYALSYPEVLNAAVRLVLAPLAGQDRLICLSEPVRQAYRAILADVSDALARRGWAPELPSGLLQVIPFGVDAQRFVPGDRPRARRGQRLPPHALIALQVGRLTPTDKADWETLLWLAGQMRQRRREFLLVLAGADSMDFAARLRQRARVLGVEGSVRVIPSATDDAILQLYQASDLFVMAGDSPQESQGLALLEAMACGLPVVAPDWDGYREMLAGDGGLLIPTKMFSGEAGYGVDGFLGEGAALNLGLRQAVLIDRDALLAAVAELCASPDRRRSMGEHARRRVLLSFSEEGMVRAYETMWHAATRGAVAPSPAELRLTAPWPDLGQAFARHYPTCTFTAQALVRLRPSGLARDALPDAGYERGVLESICAILEAGPRRMEEVERLMGEPEGQRVVRRHLLALLKSGAVDLVEADAEAPHHPVRTAAGIHGAETEA